MFGDKIKDLNTVNDEPETKDFELVSNIFGHSIQRANHKKSLISAAVIAVVFLIFSSSYFNNFAGKYIKNPNYKTILTTSLVFLVALVYFYFSKYMLKED